MPFITYNPTHPARIIRENGKIISAISCHTNTRIANNHDSSTFFIDDITPGTNGSLSAFEIMRFIDQTQCFDITPSLNGNMGIEVQVKNPSVVIGKDGWRVHAIMKHTGASIERVGNGKVFLVKDSPWRGGSAVVARDMILEVDANPTVLMEKLMSRHSVGKSQVNIEKSQMKAEESQVNIEKSQVKVVKKQVRFLESQVKMPEESNEENEDLSSRYRERQEETSSRRSTISLDKWVSRFEYPSPQPEKRSATGPISDRMKRGLTRSATPCVVPNTIQPKTKHSQIPAPNFLYSKSRNPSPPESSPASPPLFKPGWDHLINSSPPFSVSPSPRL